MSDSNDEEISDSDPRPACKYGSHCYARNEPHRKKYKHPPGHDPNKTTQRSKVSDRESPPRKRFKENVESPPKNTTNEDSPDKAKDSEDSAAESKDEDEAKKSPTLSALLADCKIKTDVVQLSKEDAQLVIPQLFLTKMPEEFYQLYEFCKSLSMSDPLKALEEANLKLVGPYSVFDKNFLQAKVENKELFLRHWRYYYDPPEFQTLLVVSDKPGLHFGYWRDEPTVDPIFVAKNNAQIDCLIVPVAATIFAAIDFYLTDKIEIANPFKKTSIKRLQQKLRKYANDKSISLKKTNDLMQKRSKNVVAKTFHKAGIVVRYDKRTQLGYRELSVTEKDLRKILEGIEKAPSAEARKPLMSKLQEVVRLATIAADECDFGTCLELGHDLFSSGITHVHGIVLQILSTAYNLLERAEFESIIKVHLKDRIKEGNLSVF